MVGLVSTLQLLRQATATVHMNNRKGLLQFCREQERSRGDTYHKPRVDFSSITGRGSDSNEQPTHIKKKTNERARVEGEGRKEEDGRERRRRKKKRTSYREYEEDA
jgi:hypothetical protein